jgi:hypothetical protein
MSVVHFQCPSCQTPLRLENRALFVGRSFDCPDCCETLLIEAEGSTGVKASPIAASASVENLSLGSASQERRTAGHPNSHKVTDLGVSLQGRQSAWDRLSRRPAVLGWIVAALFAVILFFAISPGRHPTSSEVDPANVAQANSETDSAKKALPAESSEQRLVVDQPTPKTNDDRKDEAEVGPGLPVPPLPVETVAEPPHENKPNPEAARADEKPPEEPPKPIAPPTPEEVEAKLQQKIARFDQSKPVAFVKVLDTIEELAGVPIVWDLERVDE